MSQVPPPLSDQTGSRPDLRIIASRQKGVILALVVYVAAFVVAMASRGQASPLQLVPALIGIAASVLALVFVFLLAMRVYHPVVGILMAIFTLIPLIGLLMLLAVNGRATRILRKNGVKVGFFGADLNKIP